MPTPQDIKHQTDLLEAHRATLRIRLIQLAKVGSANTRPEVFHDIDEARAGILAAKTALRAWEVDVEDLPGDEATPIRMPRIEVSPENIVFYDRIHLFSHFTEEPFTMSWLPQKSFEYLSGPELENYSVECEIRILDDNNDPFSWAGFRIRGFKVEIDHVGFGYLVHLRSLGTVEIYRKTKTIGGEGKQLVANAKGTWVKFARTSYHQE